MNKTNNRLQYLDIARGIGILMVMYSHSLYNNRTIMIYISGCFIQLFFVVSGYLSKASNGGGYLWHRIKFLLGPYFLFSLILCTINCIFNRGLSFHNIIGVFYSRFYLYPIHVDQNILLMEMWNSPMWFLTAMVVTVCLWEFLSSRKKKHMVFWSLLFFITIFLMQRLPVLLPWSIDVAPLFTLFMLVGYLLKTFKILEKVGLIYIMGGLLIYVFICFLNGAVGLSIREYGVSPIFVLITGILGSILIIKLSMLLERVTVLSILLSEIGRNSTCIFCTHVLTYAFLYKVYSFILGTLGTYNIVIPNILLLILSIIIASLVGVVISLFLKRYIPSIIR